jgi:hypothetical protein
MARMLAPLSINHPAAAPVASGGKPASTDLGQK